MTTGNTFQKWEYIVVQYTVSIWRSDGEWDRPELKDFTTEQMLNHYGLNGWELVKIGPVHESGGAPSAAYILKRQVA